MTIVLILAAVVLVTAVIIVFNRLIRLRNACSTAWSDIDVQLKRRHDLVRNVVEVVRGYTDFERTTLENVTKARAQAAEALDSGDPGPRGPS